MYEEAGEHEEPISGQQARAIERAWIEESQRRYSRILAGFSELVDDEEVMAELDALYP
jgi:hypothetical protein